LNCPNCDKEIIDEDAEVCPNCGESLVIEEEYEEEPQNLDIQPRSCNIVVAVAVFTIIAAVIITSLGGIGVYQYPALLNYYGDSYASNFMGFLIFGIVDIICGLAAIVGGVFMLKKKHLKFSIFGAVFVLAAVGSTCITMVQYEYNFTDIVIFALMAALMLSIVSIMLVFTSRDEFIQEDTVQQLEE